MTTHGTSIATYRARRDFAATPEPRPDAVAKVGARPIFVVQKHHARRLHWDFRLQQGQVLWSWAVPKGPSMQVGLKRLAVRTEDHPLAYATFQGTIPQGHYGAGSVAQWDFGTWQPVGYPAKGLADGELKFTLAGKRLTGKFVLVRMKPRTGEKAENWLLIKERDAAAARPRKAPEQPAMPDGAVPAAMPRALRLQLATDADEPPAGEGWLHEIKFDGYRLLAFCDGRRTRLVTRNGLDWTSRLPTLAQAFAAWPHKAVVDGELVANRADGFSDFGLLQKKLSEGSDRGLVVQAFDLTYLDGFDLRRCRLEERKRLLEAIVPPAGPISFTTHLAEDAASVRKHACAMGLEGVIAKRADAFYTPGRSRTWLKLKCFGRDEFVVLGFTPPSGSRQGFGALHVGYYGADGQLHYSGGVGSGFDEKTLAALAGQLGKGSSRRPAKLRFEGEPPDAAIRWVPPGLVIEVQHAGLSAAGRLRHAVFLGLREDKAAADVKRDHAAPKPRQPEKKERPMPRIVRAARAAAKQDRTPLPAVVVAQAARGGETVAGITLTHPDRALWPGITKRMLADYWIAIAPRALGGIAKRPLALVRCPEGISGESFFQKHFMRGQPAALRAETSKGDPYLAIDDVAGLVACAQLSAIELHAWGATEADPDHPDQLVFDLDPGEGVAFPAVIEAAKTVQDALKARGLAALCRTSGGKGLHVLVPLKPKAGWEEARQFAKGFAEALSAAEPKRFVSTTPKALRRGKILIDWLRNGRGATAIASYAPRAREGATVATPLAWAEVKVGLDPADFTLETVPARVKRQRKDPWETFDSLRVPLPAGARRRVA